MKQTRNHYVLVKIYRVILQPCEVTELSMVTSSTKRIACEIARTSEPGDCTRTKDEFEQRTNLIEERIWTNGDPANGGTRRMAGRRSQYIHNLPACYHVIRSRRNLSLIYNLASRQRAIKQKTHPYVQSIWKHTFCLEHSEIPSGTLGWMLWTGFRRTCWAGSPRTSRRTPVCSREWRKCFRHLLLEGGLVSGRTLLCSQRSKGWTPEKMGTIRKGL